MIHLPKIKLTFIAVLAIAGFSSNPQPGWTQLSSPVITDLPSAPGTGTPDNNRTSTAGVSRGGCQQVDKQTDKQLTALVPIKGSESLTTAEHPVFWFYIPDAPKDINSIEFSLHPKGGDEKTTLYRTSLQPTKTPGVIGIPLPPSPKNSLKFNESYHWRIVIICDQKKASEDPIVLELDGWVTRVQRSPNLWYDELTNLAKRYLSEPQNTELKNDWTELLKSVGLEGIAQAPLVSSVSNPKKNFSVQLVK